MILGQPAPRPIADSPPALTAWLDLATRNLESSAQPRIRTEIETQYAESVQAHRSEGCTDEAAHAAALAQLGDPTAAGKLLSGRLARLGKADVRIFSIVSAVQIYIRTLMAVGLVIYFHPKPLGLAVGLPLALCCLVSILAFGITRRLRRGMLPRLVLVLQVLAWLTAGSFILLSCFDPVSDMFVRFMEPVAAFGLTLAAARITWKASRLNRPQTKLEDSVMSVFRLPTTLNLSQWLEIATKDLIPSAQTRVRTEIETHYAEAVKANTALGLSEAEANAAAMKDLGNAHTAHWHFWQKHLTTTDTESVFSQAESQIWMGAIWTGCLVANLFYSGPVSAAVGLLIILSLFLGWRVFKVSLRQSPKVVSRRLVDLLLAITWLNVAAFLLMTHFDTGDDPFPRTCFQAMAIGFIIIAAAMSFRHFRLRKKLASATDDDLPPQDSASA